MKLSPARACRRRASEQHTVRGTFAVVPKKKPGLNLSSEKAQGGERVYRSTV